MNKKSVSLLALALAAAFAGSAGATILPHADSNLTVSATLTSACEVSEASSINLGSYNALESAGDMTGDSKSTFQVACSSDLTPAIYATGNRYMANGANHITFGLGLSADDAMEDALPAAPGGASFTLTKDGSLHDVVLYAYAANSAFKDKPSGAYTAPIVVSVEY